MSNNRNREGRDRDLRREDRDENIRRANSQDIDDDRSMQQGGGVTHRTGHMNMPGSQNRSRKKK